MSVNALAASTRCHFPTDAAGSGEGASKVPADPTDMDGKQLTVATPEMAT